MGEGEPRCNAEDQIEAERLNDLVNFGKLTTTEASNIQKDQSPNDLVRIKRRQEFLATGVDQKSKDMDYVRSIVERVRRRAEEGKTTKGYAPNETDFYDLHIRGNESDSRRLLEVINKYPLVDLGAGKYGVFYDQTPQKGRFHVDPYNDPELHYNRTRLVKKMHGKGKKEVDFEPIDRPDIFNTREVEKNVFYSQTDMLEFLSKLPDKFVNITMNGIDPEVIDDEEYMDLIASQAERVMPDDGVFLVAGARDSFNQGSIGEERFY